MNEIDRYKKLDEAIQKLKGDKIRIEERFNAKKERLEQLISEIKGKGYDPKNLASIKEEKEKELNKIFEDLEKGVREVNEKLNAIEV